MASQRRKAIFNDIQSDLKKVIDPAVEGVRQAGKKQVDQGRTEIGRELYFLAEAIENEVKTFLTALERHYLG